MRKPARLRNNPGTVQKIWPHQRDTGTIRPTVTLTACGAKYMTALNNPFHPYAVGACVPTALSLPSWKFTTLTRMHGEMYGAGGSVSTLGGVSFYPFRTLYDTTRMSPSTAAWFPALICSSKNKAQTGDFPFSNTSNPHTGDLDTNVRISAGSISPFRPAVAKENTVFARLVGAALRVRYTGNVVGAGGAVAVWRPQYNCSEVPADADSPAQLERNPQAAIIPLRPSLVVEIVYTPKLTSDIDYFPLPKDDYSGPSASNVEAPIQSRLAGLIAFMGVDPNGQFECEAMAHWEVQGANQPAATRNSTDLDAVGLAVSAAPSGPSSPEPAQRVSAVGESMSSYVQDNGVKLVAAAETVKNLNSALKLGQQVISTINNN